MESVSLRDKVGLVFFAVVVLVASSYCQSGHKRNLGDIKYKFTPCGALGQHGPTYSTCLQYYAGLNNSPPQVRQNLLFRVDNKELSGAQGFRVPTSGLYNITIAGARGGRGICNPLRGYGYRRTVQVELSTEYELLIFVGQRGTEPCDVIPKSKDTYATFCQEPPFTIANVRSCNETWFNFTQAANFDPMFSFYEVFGGGGGGGGSLVRSRRRNSTAIDPLPIVIAGGGGGTASVLDYDVTKNIGNLNTDQLEGTAESYQALVNASAKTHSTNYGSAGMQGYHDASLITRRHTVPGAGGGYSLDLQNQSSIVDAPVLDGRALHRGGSGGMACTEVLMDASHTFLYSGVYGGFGGGGGACGGGGGGGGYTGGAILASGVTVPGEGGYSYVRENVSRVSDMTHYNNSEPDGFVEIILANCGCTHECLMDLDEDRYECLCPSNTMLAPDLNDCFFKDKEMSISEGPMVSFGSEYYYKFVQLSSSAFILGNHIDIQSNNEMCVLFWLGDESQIVLTTNVVRSSGKVNKLAVIQGNTPPVDFAPVTVDTLNSSVLVAGAVLFGTGDCSINNDIIHVSTSIQTPAVGAIQAEDFRKSNKSVLEQEAVALADVLFAQANTPGPKAVNKSGKVAIIVVMMLTVITVVAIVATVIGYLAYKRKRIRLWSSNYKIIKPSRTFKDSLILNAAYSKYSSASPSPFRPLISERDRRYEIFVHGSENDSYATLSPIEMSISPLHGVFTPQHDFSEFNVQRRSTLISDCEWSYPRGNLMYMRELGEGQFGKVLLMKAKDIAGYSGQIPVAVKTLTSRDPDVIKKFREEAELMKKFSHPNIVSLLGFIQEEMDEDGAPLMILEYMQYGDLASFLRTHSPVDGKPSLIGEENFRTFAINVALGLEFLSSMKYVHRDIAARNCLVGAGLHIKIADFGLARAVHNKDYYKVGGASVLPVRWMAPESLLFGVFSSASDVWSFGVLLWETVSYGGTPLEDVSMEDIVNAAQDGALCHARPPNCSDYLYELMSDCLKQNCDDRPGFNEIVSYLTNNYS